jgi:hypothetical protein
VHVRPVAALLGRMLAEDSRPLIVAREPAARLPGHCRHFTVLAAALLCAQGTPARARCGFGGWKLADAQIDEVQRKLFDVDFDLMDVPRDKFLVVGDAWRLCRGGGADPATFGFSLLNQGGYWWTAANLLRDVAALNNMEMLPWDVWGAMTAPDETIGDELSALFDRLAGLTGDPDAAFAELTTAYADDSRLHVPATVYNAVLNRPEPILGEDRGSNPPP